MEHQCKNILLCLAFIPLFLVAKAQRHLFKNSSFGVQGNYGSYLTKVPKATYLKDSYTYFGELYYQQQKGYDSARVTILQPEVGAGIFFGNSGSRKYMGNMAGVFYFVHFPLIKASLYSSKIRIGYGTGWIEKPYDKNTNHKNVLIGSHLNGYMNLLWQSEFRISSHVFVNAGLSFSHLSNAGMKLPNLGLNTPALSFGMRYIPRVQEHSPVVKADPAPFHNKQTSLWLSASAGFKQAPWVGSKYYLINAVTPEITRQYSRNNQFGGGFHLYYNRALAVDPATITSNKREGKNVQAGIFASFERSFGKLSIPLQMGAYLFNKDMYSLIYQQIGVRYKINDHWRAQLQMKTHAGTADFIHAGIGYKLK